MSRFGQALKKKWALLTTLVVTGIAVVVVAFFFGQKADASDYLTAKAARQSVEVTVSATGTVQAVTTVQVGSQASGTVAWLGVDFNSQVKQGQVIAKLDPSNIEAQVENARASVAGAQAAVQAAENEIATQSANVQAAKAAADVARIERDDAASVARRYGELKEVVAAREIESAKSQANVAAGRLTQASAQVAQVESGVNTSRARLGQAKAQLSQAQAQLEQAMVNLDNTVITSPIDGIVVSRTVDVGQTVAASLQAPTLFTIANDLTKMRVLASVDEADVGQIREGTEASFTVDAFPGETFEGTVSQIRLDAQALQNVVTYTVVVEVSNPKLRLRPGMTANITFPVDSREDVIAIPNAALRFKPSLSQAEQQAARERMQVRRQANANSSDGQPAGQRSERGSGGDDQDEKAGSNEGGRRAGGQMVWVLAEGGTLEPRYVRTGLTDGRVTEVVSGNLREGELIVTGQTGGETTATGAQPTRAPFGQQRGGGSPGGRRGR